MTATYISGGSIVRDSRDLTFTSFVRWEKVLLILIPAFILVLTNPANQSTLAATLHEADASVPFTQEFFDFTQSYGMSKWRTNYIFFSFQKQFDRLKIFALNNRWECDYSNPGTSFLCSELGHLMSTDWDSAKLWNRTDRDLFATRTISLFLVSSWIFFFCCPGYSTTRIAMRHPFLYRMMNIFLRPQLTDLISANTAVYFALKEMRKNLAMVRRGSFFHTGDADFDYVLGVLILIWLIGNGANLLASRLCSSPPHNIVGFDSVKAACLMYLHQCTFASDTVYWLFGFQIVNAAGLFWANIPFIILSRDKSDWFPHAVAWVSAGWAGHLLAQNHLENIFIIGRVFRGLGLT